MSSLLPQQYEKLEHALEHAGGARLSAIQSPAASLWNAETCPEHHLPHLAAAVSVDFWDDAWPSTRKREMIKQSPELHRLKGTPAGLVEALNILNYPNSYVTEHVAWQHDGTVKRDGRIKYSHPLMAEHAAWQHDGKVKRDGRIKYGHSIKWYDFDVHLQSGRAPTAGELAVLRRYIESFKAAHARLRRIYYGVRKHDGAHKRDGTINYDAGRTYG